jgi:hypothetical protein
MQEYKIFLVHPKLGLILERTGSTEQGAKIVAAMFYRKHHHMVDVIVSDPRGKTVFIKEAKYK